MLEAIGEANLIGKDVQLAAFGQTRVVDKPEFLEINRFIFSEAMLEIRKNESSSLPIKFLSSERCLEIALENEQRHGHLEPRLSSTACCRN